MEAVSGAENDVRRDDASPLPGVAAASPAPEVLPPTGSLRPVRPGDEAFLREVYASTRAQELALAPWTPAQKADFLRLQFDAQDAFYRAQFPAADFLLIQSAGQPAGRLYLERREREILVIDAALLPAHRRSGIGRSLFTALFAEGRRTGKTICGQVEWWNPALHFFTRLGFQTTGHTGLHYQIRWFPAAPATP